MEIHVWDMLAKKHASIIVTRVTMLPWIKKKTFIKKKCGTVTKCNQKIRLVNEILQV